MSRGKRIALGLLLLVLVLAGLAVLDALRGGLDVARGRDATSWSGACFRQTPRWDRQLLERCARVDGRVVRVRTTRGTRLEVHAALVVDFGVVLVKLLDPPPGAIPGVGERMTAVGPLVRARNGFREVQAFAAGDPLRPVVERIRPRRR